MNTIPSAVLTELAGKSQKPPVRTTSGKVHQGWKGDNPIVHGIDNVATIKLDDERTLGARTAAIVVEHTKRPSDSHWFKSKATLGTIPIALE